MTIDNFNDNRFGLQFDGTAETPEVAIAYRPSPTDYDKSVGYLDRFFVIYSNWFQEVDADTYFSTTGPKSKIRWHIKNQASYTAAELNRMAIDTALVNYPVLYILKKRLDFLVS